MEQHRFRISAISQKRISCETSPKTASVRSTSAVRPMREGLVCGRIIFGLCSDRFRIVNGVSPMFGTFAIDRIPL